MKKRIGSLLLILALCFTLLPTAAFAEENGQSSKITITTVDELLQFAKAVDNGEYDGKADAVVSLDADLDLTGIAWTPIGSKFDTNGTLLHYFSGKFYGNGHTISNLDFSENYGKTEYPSFGFFSEVYGAEISGLTIQGKLDVSNSGYVYFGTVAGVAADSKISDCVSDVSFTDTDKYINGTVALCGYAINSTIEHCQNKGNFSVTTDTTSLQMGGIVGVADNSTVQYCANTGDMTSWTPCTGGIVGQLFQNSKIINCYSTGKMVPLGNGTTDFGGIAGIVGAGTEIRHCYFAGEMDLSQYTATTPYKRLGGIAGGVSSEPPVFENNYFTETENDTSYREECYRIAKEEGPQVLYERLRKIDPAYAETIHANNVKRVTRALEYHYLTGQRFSEHNAEQKERETPYNAAVILLTMEREALYARIEQRIDLMMQQGLLAEVKGLLDRGYSPKLVSMQGIGYKEFVPYFNGDCTLDEAVTQLKTNTRRFAKRQLTWFRRQIEGLWIDMSKTDGAGALAQTMTYLKERGVLQTNNNS